MIKQNVSNILLIKILYNFHSDGNINSSFVLVSSYSNNCKEQVKFIFVFLLLTDRSYQNNFFLIEMAKERDCNYSRFRFMVN